MVCRVAVPAGLPVPDNVRVLVRKERGRGGGELFVVNASDGVGSKACRCADGSAAGSTDELSGRTMQLWVQWQGW